MLTAQSWEGKDSPEHCCMSVHGLFFLLWHISMKHFSLKKEICYYFTKRQGKAITTVVIVIPLSDTNVRDQSFRYFSRLVHQDDPLSKIWWVIS